MIIRSTHEFGPGLARTKLHTKWVHSSANQLDTDAEIEELESNRGDGEGNQCRTLRSSRPSSPATDPPAASTPTVASGMLGAITNALGIGDEGGE